MTRNTKIFLGACIASFALWLFVGSGMTLLTDRFSSRAVAVEQPEETGPKLKPEALSLDMQAKSAFVMYVAPDNTRQVLFAKEAEQKLPIASLTKLMTALVALQFYGPEENIVVSLRAIQEEGDQGELFEGQNITAHDILYPLLLESSNDAAAALAEHKGMQTFMNRMNYNALRLGLVETSFVNPPRAFVLTSLRQSLWFTRNESRDGAKRNATKNPEVPASAIFITLNESTDSIFYYVAYHQA